jgi:hypothetical protein
MEDAFLSIAIYLIASKIQILDVRLVRTRTIYVVSPLFEHKGKILPASYAFNQMSPPYLSKVAHFCQELLASSAVDKPFF